MSKQMKHREKQAEFLAGLEFTMPDEAAWEELVKGHRLSERQVHALRICLRHVDQDLRDYAALRRSLPDRGRAVNRFKLLAKAFGTLDAELKRAGKDLGYILPFETRAFIGRSMSFTAIGEAIGGDSFPIFVDNAMSLAIAEGRPMTQRDIEHEGRPGREALGLKHGGDLLCYLIAGIREPMKRWMELDRENKGGRSQDRRRGHVIYWLALEAEAIIGRKATIAVTGPFARLCEAVFVACGLPTKGLEKAIPNIVKRARKDLKAREGYPPFQQVVPDADPDTGS